MKASVVALMGIGASAMAAVEPFSCPTELVGVDQQARQAPAGWQAAVEGPGESRHHLNGFTINLGPVSKSDGAIYDDVTEKKDARGHVTSTLVWQVKPLQDAYAVCSYYRTSVVLTRPLTGYTECKAVSRRTRDTQFRLEEASCR
ncbi:STY0301 family protein [Roseateles sp. YR242]|uniref:STY0301 family protein n=1 Tax=Roseateles sp. YR242 TaxID=1855305 RepID=UPI0011600C1D|nr:STY0301 family protein [Roseateles sp. YR242]